MQKEPVQALLNQTLDQMAYLKRKREELTFEHLMKVKSLLTHQQAQEMFSNLVQHIEKEKD